MTYEYVNESTAGAAPTIEAAMLDIEQAVNELAVAELELADKGRLLGIVEAMLKLTDIEDDADGTLGVEDEHVDEGVEGDSKQEHEADAKDDDGRDEQHVADEHDDASDSDLLLLYEHQRARL